MRGSTATLIRKYAKLFGHPDKLVKDLYKRSDWKQRTKMREDMKSYEPYYAKES